MPGGTGEAVLPGGHAGAMLKHLNDAFLHVISAQMLPIATKLNFLAHTRRLRHVHKVVCSPQTSSSFPCWCRLMPQLRFPPSPAVA